MNNALRLIAPLLLAAIGMAGCERAAPDAPLAGARLGGPFTLTDQDGRRVSDTAFAGRYRLFYFGYTFCPDVCPTTLQQLARGLRAFEAEAPAMAQKIQPIFVTVDPLRDTPAVLKPYVAAFHPRLIGLTGTPAEIAAVEKSYGVFAQIRPPEQGATGYLVDHMSQPILFGPEGEPIALIAPEGEASDIAAQLAKWVR